MARAPRPALWGLGFAALYLWGGARLPQWGDASKLTLYALHAHVPSLNPGDHAGWTLAAWLWLQVVPADPVIACHRFSALAGALSVALLVKLLALREEPPHVVRGAAVVWGLAHASWWAASMTETYTLAFALSLGALVAEKTARPFWSGLLAGWAAATHGLTLFLTAPALVKGERRAARAVGFFAGASPSWLGLLVAPGQDPLTGHASGGIASLGWHVASFLSASRLSLGAALVIGLLVWNLGPLGAWAWWKGVAPRRRVPWPLVALGIFLAAYSPFRLHLMVGFLLLGVLLWKPPSLTRAGAAVQAALQVVLYFGLPSLLTHAGLGDLSLRPLPYRNNAAYFLTPTKRGELGAWRYALEMYSMAPPNAMIVADFNPGAVLKLVQETRGLRPDVTVIPTVVDDCVRSPNPGECLALHLRRALEQGRPVMLADSYEPYYRLQELEKLGFEVSLQRTGVPFKSEVKWRADPNSHPGPAD